MNPLSDTEFCANQIDYSGAADDIVTYLNTNNSQFNKNLDNITKIYNGVGLGTSTSKTFNLAKFYEFWSINENRRELGDIINDVTVPKINNSTNYTSYDTCKISRTYNKTILQGFFCNPIPNKTIFPVLGENTTRGYVAIPNYSRLFRF